MIGTLEIYQGYVSDGNVEISKEPVYRKKNMIVDGAKECVVDLMTRIPSPTGIETSTSSTYEVSNYTIQGMSISPNEGAFSRFDSLIAASAYVVDLTGNMTFPGGATSVGSVASQREGEVVWSSMDASSTTEAWALLPDMPNYEFTSVNSGFSGANYINGLLDNVTFSSVTNLLKNSTFKQFGLDSSLSAASMNNILRLYELDRWDIQSCLRYRNELTEYTSKEWCGSVSRDAITDISALSSLVASGYADSDDGVLFVRTFAASSDESMDSSAGVRIKQTFTPAVAEDAFTPRQKDDATLSMVAEITAKSLCVSGGFGGGYFVYLKNETSRECYNFSAAGSFARNEWGGSGSPLWIPLSEGVSSTLSHFVNIPNTMANDRMTLEFSFVADDNVGFLTFTHFWDVGVNVLDGWYYGHVCEYDTLQRVYNNDFTNPQLFLNSTGRSDVTKPLGELPLSSITYISQLFSMAPNKLYTPNIWGECRDGYGNPQGFYAAQDEPPGGPLLDIAVVKKATSNYKKGNSWNYLTKSKGGNPSQWLIHLAESGLAPNPLDNSKALGTSRCKKATNDGFPTSSTEYSPSSWIPACSAGCNSLVESCLDEDTVWHYLLPHWAPPNWAGYRVKNQIYPVLPTVNPKPSDLCVEVPPVSRTFQTAVSKVSQCSSYAVSGEFGMANTTNARFSGKVLKNKYITPSTARSSCAKDGAVVSATDFYFVLRTSDSASDGKPRYFNFSSGAWDNELSNQTKFFTSAIESTEEWAAFSSIPVDTSQLSGVVEFRQSACQTSGTIPRSYAGNEPWEKGWYGYSLILSAVNVDGAVWQDTYFPLVPPPDSCGYFKELKFEAEAKTVAQDVPECYDWTTTGDGTTYANCWRVIDGATRGYEDPQYGFSDVTVFPYVEYYNATGLSELPFECVNQMCYASGSIHSTETEYQFVVGCSRQNNALSGGTGAQAIRAVTLNDNTTVAIPKTVSGDFYTSEPYYNCPRFDIVGYPHVQQLGKIMVSSGDYSGNFQGCHMKSPIASATWMISSTVHGQPHNYPGPNLNVFTPPDAQTSSLFPTENAFFIGTRKFLGYGSLPVIDFCQVFELKDLPLDPKTDKLAFGFDYQFYDEGRDGEPRTMWVATAQLDNGEIMWWRDSSVSTDGTTVLNNGAFSQDDDQKAQSWVSNNYMSKGIPHNPYKQWLQQGYTGYGPNMYKRAITRPIDLSDNRFTPTTKIRLGIREISLKQEDVLSIKNWDFYRVTPKPTSGSLPVFPNPVDTTVQPATTETPGDLGHFSNRIALTSYLSSVRLERALADGGWAPPASFTQGAGKYSGKVSPIAVSGSVVSGVANKYGIVNSDGIVYKLPPGESAISNKFFMNGVSSTVSSLGGGSSAMLYIFDVSSDDLDFFDHYGGIGGIGLWALNADETFKKFDKYSHDITTTNTVYDLSAYPLATSLYNVTDVTRNPVYRLFSKKVFKNPLQKGPADFIRIKWYVQLV